MLLFPCFEIVVVVIRDSYQVAYLSDWDGHIEFYCDWAMQCRLRSWTPLLASAGPELCDQAVLTPVGAKITNSWSCTPQNYVVEKRKLRVWSQAMQSTSRLCCVVGLETSASVFLLMPFCTRLSMRDKCSWRTLCWLTEPLLSIRVSNLFCVRVSSHVALHGPPCRDCLAPQKRHLPVVRGLSYASWFFMLWGNWSRAAGSPVQLMRTLTWYIHS